MEIGSEYEDEEYYKWPIMKLRSTDHFYTVTSSRTPGSALGITDNTEGPLVMGTTGIGWKTLPDGITNSFAWAALNGISGPQSSGIAVGLNLYNWPQARSYEYAALTSSASTDRGTNMAMLLYSLGHILHLNQDLSQPDHVRNDNHFYAPHRFIENYGVQNYLKNPAWFYLQFRGWPYWQSKGYSQLLDFWDTGAYHGDAADLNADAASTDILGLAEFTSGNFLGEDALYNEVIPLNDTFHFFPYPSLKASTDYPNPANVLSSVLKNGQVINKMRISKTKDGITVTNHSIATFIGAKAPFIPTRDSISIDDSNVLQEYHSSLIPKAVEYSAGILDYFFRGSLGVTFTNASAPYLGLEITNNSTQDLNGGSFRLFYDDASYNRHELISTNFTSDYSGATAPQGIINSLFIPNTNATQYFLVYQGTIGTVGGVPSDPVDTNIAVAVTNFSMGQLNFNNLAWQAPTLTGPASGSAAGNSAAGNVPADASCGEAAHFTGTMTYTGANVSCHCKFIVSDLVSTDGNSGAYVQISDPNGIIASSEITTGPGDYSFDFTVPVEFEALLTVELFCDTGSDSCSMTGSIAASIQLTPAF